eukprot:423559_1
MATVTSQPSVMSGSIDNSKERKYECNEDSHDDYTECLFDPNNDRRTIICDSENISDSIIQCIGSIETHYIPDANIKQTEKLHGTGTVINIDDQNNLYILTAAHNICGVEKECSQCQTKTLKPKCSQCTPKHKTEKTGTLIQPTHIYFTRRGHGVVNELGKAIRRYQVDDYKMQKQYYQFPTPRSGYDICILITKCNDKNDIDMYKENCKKITLINDEMFGNNKSVLYIYGYPGEKRQVCDFYRVNYYLFGMGSSKLDATNQFSVQINDN